MLAHGIAGAHNDVAMAGVMALALVVAVERSWVLGAVVGGFAAAVKLPAGLVCVGVGLVSLPVATTLSERLRRFSTVGALSVGALLATGAAAGLGVGWIHALDVPGEVKTPFSVTTQLGQLVGLVLHALGTGVTVDGAVAVARALGSAAALVIAARIALRAPTGDPAAGVRATALVMVAVLALSPAVHPWYLMWCLPLIAVGHLSARSSAALLHLSWFIGLVAPLGLLGGAVTAVGFAAVLVGGASLRQWLSHRSSVASPGVADAVVEGG
jgi:alpha-1,6-mannosyltransferase